MAAGKLFRACTLELDRRGQIIGIEILDASKYLRSFVLEHYRAAAVTASR